MSGGAHHLTFTPLSEGRVEVGRGRNGVPMSLIIDNACRVYITQIPLERIERDGANALRAEFEAFGPVESYKMFTERSGRFIGSVLCTYRNPADASAAVHNMDGQIIEGSVLKVSLSRDHGVVLLHHTGSKGRYSNDNDDDDDGNRKWQHDQYQALIEGCDDHDRMGGYAYRRGGGGGRRGRGGRGGRGVFRSMNSVEEAFERYIASRDKAVMKTSASMNTTDVSGALPNTNEETEGKEIAQINKNDVTHITQTLKDEVKMTGNEDL